MKFRISTLLFVIALVSVCRAWWAQRLEKIRLEVEVTQLAGELYREHARARFLHDDEKFIKMIGYRSGEILDVSKRYGRIEMMQRLDRGEANFRVKMGANGAPFDMMFISPVSPERPYEGFSCKIYGQDLGRYQLSEN